MKKCTSCDITKALNSFHKNKASKDGFVSRCKDCISEYQASRYVDKRVFIKRRAKTDREKNKIVNSGNPIIRDSASEIQKCYDCETSKTLNNFYKDFSRKNGFSNLCKTCSLDSASDWQRNNKKKVKIRGDKYRKNNLDKHCFTQAKRRAKKLNATPSWLTEEQIIEMAEIYSLAKELQWLSEEPLEVDRIIPLQGKDVSGLHVPWNLQILPESMNRSKSNKLGPRDIS
jgi:hypothetical protein